MAAALSSRLRRQLQQRRLRRRRVTMSRCQSPLLRVPGELRNQIYEYLVVFAEPVDIYRRHVEQGERLYQRLTRLFLTCRQVHLEASAVFYSHNRFSLPPGAHRAPLQLQANFLLRGFLDRVGPRNAAALRHLVGVPFPLDPWSSGQTASLQLARRRTRRGPTLEEEVAEEEQATGAGLMAALRRRCPGLATVGFDLSAPRHYALGRLCGSAPALVALLGRLDGDLRAAFPSLKQVSLSLEGPAPPRIPAAPYLRVWDEVTEAMEARFAWTARAVSVELPLGKKHPCDEYHDRVYCRVARVGLLDEWLLRWLHYGDFDIL